MESQNQCSNQNDTPPLAAFQTKQSLQIPRRIHHQTQTLASQDLLNSSIDRLTRELDQLLEDAPLPFIMQHAAKFSNARKRVSSWNFPFSLIIIVLLLPRNPSNRQSGSAVNNDLLRTSN